MKTRARLTVPHSVLLIRDRAIGAIPEIDIPESMQGRRVASTASCVAVGTAVECDATVEIELTESPPQGDAGLSCDSKSKLQTPNRGVVASSIHHVPLAAIPVGHDLTEVQVWVNHPTEPDRIVIAVRPVTSR
jgi:hypothetical protein